jgi:hypothetical protein
VEKKMKSSRFLLVLSLTFAGFLLVGTAAKADTVLTLFSPNQSGFGPVFEFDGTLTNTGDTTVFLNEDNYFGDLPFVAFDGSPFYNNTPSSLNPGDTTGVVELFTITAPPYGPGSNFYAGTYQILGGGTSGTSDLLASEDFSVNVLPEPSSLVLMLTGLAGLAGTIRRRLIR